MKLIDYTSRALGWINLAVMMKDIDSGKEKVYPIGKFLVEDIPERFLEREIYYMKPDDYMINIIISKE